MKKRTFLEVGDLPKDELGVLYKLRPALVRVFNLARSNKRNMTLLRKTLAFVHNKCKEFEANQAKAEEERALFLKEQADKERKDAVVAAMADLGVDADERKGVAKLEAELSVLLEQKASENSDTASE